MIWRRLLGYFPASLAGGLASFGGVYVLTRLLSPADYGFYALALTTMGIVARRHGIALKDATAKVEKHMQASPRRKAHQRPDFASWERATLNQWAREAAQRIGDIERLRSARRRAEAVS